MSDWYFRQNPEHEEVEGPISSAQLRSLVQSGIIGRAHELRRKDWDRWVQAGKVRELFPTAPPPPSTQSGSASDSSFEGRFALGLAAVVLLLGCVFLVWFLVLRDTWESDNATRLQHDIQLLLGALDQGDDERSLEHYYLLIDTIGDRALRDPELQEAWTTAATRAEPIRERHERAEEREKALAEVSSAEREAAQLWTGGQKQDAITRLDQAAALCAKHGLDEAGARVESTRSLYRDRVSAESHVKGLLDEAAAFEKSNEWPEAMSKYQQAIDNINRWSFPGEHLGSLLIEAEEGRRRAASHVRFTVSVAVISQPYGGGVPRWSVEHEIRVNGKVVDSITNQSMMATFEGVEVVVGDKITARSMWKNGYGAVATTCDRVNGDWPVVSLGTTTYLLTIGEFSSQFED